MTSTPAAATSRLALDDPEVLARVQEDFLAALPRIREHAEIQFQGIRDPGRHDDAIANTIGLGWKHWVAAVRQGKNPNTFVSAIAEYAVRQTRSGRRVDGQERAKDAMSPRAQRNKGFAVEHFTTSSRRSFEDIHANPHGQERMDAVEERLTDNTRTPPPEQAAFREQYGLLLKEVGPKKRPIIEDMAAGEDTKGLAERHKVTPGRISQIRREAEQVWRNLDRGDEEMSR